MKTLELPGEIASVAVVVTEIDEEELGSFFHDRERETLQSFVRDERRREWAASRAAAKMLAAAAAGVAPVEITLPTGDERRAVAPGHLYYVSYSHSRGAGGAAVARAPVGFDMERARRVEPATSRFFLSEEEREMFVEAGLDEALLHAWSAKEAAFKLGGCELLKQVVLSEIAVRGSGIAAVYPARGAIVRTWRVGEYIVGLAEEKVIA